MMTRETTAGRRLLLDRLAVLAAAFGVLVVVVLGLTFVSSPAWAVTINSGDILVADQAAFGGGGGVIRIDPITGAQTAVSSGGFFVDPSSITIEANGNILVADANAFGGACPIGCGGVIRVNPGTGAQTVVSSGGFFVDPVGIAVEANGNILVADANAFGGLGGVIRVNPTTGTQTVVSSGGFFLNPSALDVEANGNIVVSDQSANVPPFDGDGGVIRVNPMTGAQTPLSWGGFFGCPLGITVEASGTILTPTSPGCAIPAVIRIDPVTGTQSLVSSGGNFSLPYGLDTEADGSIIVADPNAGAAIFRVNPVTGAQSLVSSGGILVAPLDVAAATAITPPPPEISTPGKVTGGGKFHPITGDILELATVLIRTGTNAGIGGSATFGFVIQFSSGDPAPIGNLSYHDHGANVNIKSTSYNLLVISGTHAKFTGTAEVNGVVGKQFQVDVDDLGPAGSNMDTFSIQILDGSYMASGVLSGGNITIH